MKRGEEAMQILEAYDLTGTLRGAAALARSHDGRIRPVAVARRAGDDGLLETADAGAGAWRKPVSLFAIGVARVAVWLHDSGGGHVR